MLMEMNSEAKRTRSIVRVTLLGSVANFLLLVFKFVAGWLGHSSAMMADAVHSLSDFVTDVVVLLFVNLSAKPKDQDHDYGHGKYETLATSLVGLVLLFVGFGLFWEGSQKVYQFFFLHQPLDSPGWIAFAAAFVSIVVKELLGCLFFDWNGLGHWWCHLVGREGPSVGSLGSPHCECADREGGTSVSGSFY